MTRLRRRPPALGSRTLLVALILGAFASPAMADDTVTQFWPEVDGWFRLGGRARIFLLATTSAERETAYSEGMLGVHFDFRLKKNPFKRMAKLSENVVEDRLTRFSTRVGYRYGHSLKDDSYEEHRVLWEVTGRWHVPLQLLVSDRNRADFRWVNQAYSFRYRNRVTLEREAHIRGYVFTPYGSGEVYFDNRYDEFNRNRLILGVQMPLSRHLMLDTYLARQNDTRSSPAHVNALGLSLNVSY